MNPSDLRDSIPVCDRVAYMNTGATGPSPVAVVDAVNDYQTRFEGEVHAETNPYVEAFDTFERVREAVAAFLGSEPDEVALTQSTTDGINRVATAIPWERGDTVLRTDVEHSAGVLPWRRLADTRGIDVEVVGTDQGRLPVDAFAEAVERTDPSLVVFSAIDWEFGRRLPVESLVEVAHDAGARVLVDAVQAVGQEDVDVRAWGADFVAAAGHKWLLGPWGSGFLYVDGSAAEWLVPERMGYRTVREPNADDYEFEPGARRLEVATANPAPYVGLERAIELHRELGVGTFRSRVERLTDRLKTGLGDGLLSPGSFESGLVSFTADDPEAFVERVEATGIVVRSIPTNDCVRASIHAFNTADEVDRLLETVDGTGTGTGTEHLEVAGVRDGETGGTD
jgi:selenocysteine lyase/cysteine desulfurase